MSASFPQLLFAAPDGKIYPFPGLEACGMKAGRYFSLDPSSFVKLPSSSELFLLPDRFPVGLDPDSGEPVVLEADPYSEKGEKCFPVAAFIPPGYTLTHSTAFKEDGTASMLPLFAYGACVYYKDEFYVSAVRVDRGFRHDERFLDMRQVSANIAGFEKRFPKNRLIGHLQGCATVNGCANAKNFFLGRFEVPVPTSPVCNAQCQGCISFQPAGRISSSQRRIEFKPAPEEIAEIAFFHIETVSDPIVSYGQGCEGEPLLSGDVIEKSIRLIRKQTSKGVINVNTNASRPETLARLFEAGLNNVRVSLNSVREPYYSRYYQPKGYSFKEVTESVDIAKKHGGFVSLNYLSMPGFTDTAEETDALKGFIRDHGVDMIQWRNLNYDPLHYFRDLGLYGQMTELFGMGETIASIQKDFPRLKMGYFNPAKSASSS